MLDISQKILFINKYFRYTEDISPRVSLSSQVWRALSYFYDHNQSSILIKRDPPDQALMLQHHASKTMQVAGGAGYSVARVTETRKRMEIRGLN